MVNYEANHGAVGRGFSTDEIEYNGQSITVVDRLRVTSECTTCGARWIPSSLDEIRTCPNEDEHSHQSRDDAQDPPMVEGEVNVDDDAPRYTVTLDESYVEEYHFHDSGRTVVVDYQAVIRCEHCDHEWGTNSTADRPSCSRCHRKTDRETRGKYYETYLKYALFSGNESSVADVSGRLRDVAERVELMEANGWQFDCTTQSSHVALSKGDVTQQDIIA